MSHHCLEMTRLLPLLPQFPPELADNLSAAFGGGRDGLEGLRFDIPKSIDLKPTRTLLDFLPLVRSMLRDTVGVLAAAVCLRRRCVTASTWGRDRDGPFPTHLQVSQEKGV